MSSGFPLRQLGSCYEEWESNAQSGVPSGISKPKCQSGGQKITIMFDGLRDICDYSVVNAPAQCIKTSMASNLCLWRHRSFFDGEVNCQIRFVDHHCAGSCA